MQLEIDATPERSTNTLRGAKIKPFRFLLAKRGGSSGEHRNVVVTFQDTAYLMQACCMRQRVCGFIHKEPARCARILLARMFKISSVSMLVSEYHKALTCISGEKEKKKKTLKDVYIYIYIFSDIDISEIIRK